MSRDSRKLAALLEPREEQLWQLQNAALQLVTEGASSELCNVLADGLEDLRRHVVEAAAPELTACLAELTVVLRGGRPERQQSAAVFELLEALTALRRGEGDTALLRCLDAGHEVTPPATPGMAPTTPGLVDNADGADPDDLRMFAAEAREHAQQIEASLLALEATHSLPLVSEIFRGVHSIKGGAQYLGLEATATVAHRAETLLDRLRSRKLALSPRIITCLLRAFDTLSALVEALEQGATLPIDVSSIVAEVEALLAEEDAPQGAGAPGDALASVAPDEGEPAAEVPAAESVEEETAVPEPTDTGQALAPPAAELADVELFAAEYRDNMQSARDLLADLGSLVRIPDQVAVVSRNLHSIKGLAGLVGIAEIERLAGALDTLVNKVSRHGRDLAPDVQPAVTHSLDLLDEVFRQHVGSGVVTSTVDAQLELVEELAAREGRLVEWEAVDSWQALAPQAGPLADRFTDVVDALRRRDEPGSARALGDLAHAASLQGCDEVVEIAERLGREWRDLGSELLQERLLSLRAHLPADMLSDRPASRPETEMTFEEAVLAVPGIGSKKLRRLMEAGITSKDALRAAGVHGLIAIPGVNIEQAKMMLGNCGHFWEREEVTAPAAPPTPSLEQQVLADDYDRQLVGIYLDTTVQQIDATRARLQEGQAEAAAELLGDLASAARYMGYLTLVESFLAAGELLSGPPADPQACATALSSVRVGVERLRQQVARLQEGSPAGPPSEVEARELEQIFLESASTHLEKIRHDLPAFLRHADERRLASLQHHLSCLHSAATNIGRDAVVVGAERLQARIEDAWLNPAGVTSETVTDAVAMLQGLFESCGLTPPALPVEPAATLEPEPSPAIAPGDDLDSAFATLVMQETPEPSPPPVAERPATAGATPPSREPETSSPTTARGSVPARAPADGARDTAGMGLGEPVEAEPGGPDGGDAARSLVEAQATVRVDTSKIDDLMNMVAELVVNRSAFMVLSTTVNDLINRLIDSGQLGKVEARDLRMVLTRYDEAMTELGRVSNQLQQGVMRIRMMPVRTLFSRVPRLVRDLAIRESRHVRVVFTGEDTELDKTVIERLSDPLVHLIRNAISHGIESAEERVAAGKPPEGRLLISARHQGNIVIIEVEDDGRGIAFDKIRRRWAETGLGSAAQVARLSPRELLAALFLPGFSTAEKVTDVSGRGVGLDVVKRNIENLGGQVDVATEPGRFSRFTIRIPLTMAIMQALLVRVASEVYAIPVSAVIQAERITRSQIYSVENQKVITIRNSVIPLVELEEIFAYNYYLETGQTTARPGAAPNGTDEANRNGSVYVVVLQGESREIGIVVNGLVGTQDIVIKSLEDELVDGRGVAGASILGDGTVTLILDVGEIQKMVVDGQHSDEMRRSETLRRLERFIREHGSLGVERAIH